MNKKNLIVCFLIIVLAGGGYFYMRRGSKKPIYKENIHIKELAQLSEKVTETNLTPNEAGATIYKILDQENHNKKKRYISVLSISIDIYKNSNLLEKSRGFYCREWFQFLTLSLSQLNTVDQGRKDSDLQELIVQGTDILTQEKSDYFDRCSPKTKDQKIDRLGRAGVIYQISTLYNRLEPKVYEEYVNQGLKMIEQTRKYRTDEVETNYNRGEKDLISKIEKNKSKFIRND